MKDIENQMETKVNVVNRVFYFLLLLYFIGLPTERALAQSEDLAFQKHFSRALWYPKALKDACIPTDANLLIEVTKTGSIGNISVSDSAPALFKAQFTEVKAKLDLSLLTKVINEHNLKDCGIIIPLFYIYFKDECANSYDESSDLANNYMKFNGQSFSKLTFNLKPIVMPLYKVRR